MTGRTPPLIFADEPTAALDTERGTRVMGLLRKIMRKHYSAVLTVTHDHRMIEGFDSVYHMKDVRFVGPAEPRALRDADPCGGDRPPATAARPTVFLLFPFTRLVDIWSGSASVLYLLRPYQLMRRRVGR